MNRQFAQARVQPGKFPVKGTVSSKSSFICFVISVFLQMLHGLVNEHFRLVAVIP